MAISIIEIDGNSHPLGASADNVAFDGTGTGIEAGTVQEAIEEVSILAAEGAQSGVVDNLETVDGQKALSAGMGNKLDGKASVVFNHMHWPVGSSSPSVGVGSHERYYCPENHTIYHFYGRIYASEPTTTTLSYQPSKEVVYYDLETATAWRWDGTNMVLAVHPPYFMIAGSSSGAIADYNPIAPQGEIVYPRLVWFSALSKLVYLYMDGQTRRYVAFDPDPNRVYVRLGSSPKVVQYNGSAWVDVIDISSKANDNAVVKSISVNGQAQSKDTNGNVNIQVQAGDQVSVIQPDPADGTFIIRVGSTDYTINLNHTHENMAKLVVCEESDLPSTLDTATIYAQVDDADTPTEIQSLWIAGLEFVGGGGGVPDDEPRLTSPRSGATIDFEGQSTVTLFIKGKNLASALSIVATGDFTVTLNGSTVSSISASDANNGVTLTLTQGSAFSSGTISISSTEIETRTLTVDDSESLSLLDGIKLTGTQWLQTDFVPTTATDIEMKLKFTANAITETSDESRINFLSCYTLQDTNKQYTHAATTKKDQDYSQYTFAPIISASSPTKVNVSKTDFVLDKSTYRHLHGGSLTFIAGEGGTSYTGNTPAVVAQVNPLTIGFYHTSGGVDQIFNKYDLTIYEFTVKENGETLRHYVPAMKLGTPGLYDTLTGHFASSKTSTPVEVVTNS